jgi:hypothetical protein
MRLHRLAVVCFVACSQGSKPPPEIGGDGTTRVLTGAVTDYSTIAPLPGASACLLGSTSPCATTDSTGTFRLPGLATTGSGVTVALGGYVPQVWALTVSPTITGTLTLDPMYLRSTTLVGQWAQALGVAEPLGASGGVELLATSNTTGTSDPLGAGVDGVVFDVSGSPGSVGYFDPNETPDPQLTATSSTGVAVLFGIPVGTVDVSCSNPARSCAADASTAWASTMSGAVQVPIIAGSLTLVRCNCQ